MLVALVLLVMVMQDPIQHFRVSLLQVVAVELEVVMDLMAGLVVARHMMAVLVVAVMFPQLLQHKVTMVGEATIRAHSLVAVAAELPTWLARSVGKAAHG